MDSDIDKILDELFSDPESNKESYRVFDSLIEVSCHYFKKDDKILYENYEGGVWLKPLDLTTKQHNRKQSQLNNGEMIWDEYYDTVFIDDNVMFVFKVLTTDNNPSSAMLYLIENSSENEIFRDYLDDFFKHANLLKTKNLSIVKFLTAWNYRSWQDYYTNEREEDYTFEGFIDYRKFNDLLLRCLIK